jgi:hypothetical protein
MSPQSAAERTFNRNHEPEVGAVLHDEKAAVPGGVDRRDCASRSTVGGASTFEDWIVIENVRKMISAAALGEIRSTIAVSPKQVHVRNGLVCCALLQIARRYRSGQRACACKAARPWQSDEKRLDPYEVREDLIRFGDFYRELGRVGRRSTNGVIARSRS